MEPRALLAELWFAAEPAIDGERLLALVRERLPESERAGEQPVLIAHTRFVHEYADGKRAPIITAVLTPDAEDHVLERPPDTSQTYDWDEAADVLARTRHSVGIAEMFGRVHPHRDRIEAFGTTLAAAVRLWEPVAVWCPNSVRVVEPATLLDDELAALLNVRMFSVEDEPGVLVMDTLGLHVLGLPDLQCHFRDLEPPEVAALLYGAGAYLIEHGDVIESGHTIAGVRGDEHWHCRHEDALVAPDRLVLDVDPGPPYAAGNR